MKPLQKLMESNRNWAKEVTEQQPDFFAQLSLQQNPEYLWIGCADSRVPASQITGLPPGELFVHRNIANVVVHTDLNILSVIQYAVEILKIKHIIVTGHYGCGGVIAALAAQERSGGQGHGLIDHWLRHIRDVYRLHQKELQGIQAFDKRCNRLCELNVIEQVTNIVGTTIVQQAWASGQQLQVHGWIYNLNDGLLCDLDVTAVGPKNT